MAYVQSCYQNNSATNQCKLHIKKRLPLTVDQNASCPFDDSVCLHKFGNLRLDTGHIDIHEHLGVNAPPEDRFSIRRTYDCAPLKLEGFTASEIHSITSDGQEPMSSSPFFALHYGPHSTLIEKSSLRNYTYIYPLQDTRRDFSFNYTTDSSPLGGYDVGSAIPTNIACAAF